jgi:hypothetical protein
MVCRMARVLVYPDDGRLRAPGSSSRSETPGSGAFWLLGRVQAKGGCRLGESNRVGRGLGSEGHLESVEWPRGRSGRCPGGQAEVREDLGDHGGIFDGGDELQGAAALRALLDVDLEYPLEQPGPAQAHRRHGRGRRIPFLSSLSGQHSVSRSLHTPSSPTKKGTDYLTHTCDHIVSSVALSEVWRDSDQ